MEVQEQAQILQQIIERGCTDQEFRNRLLSAPKDVLAEMGIILPEGHNVQFIECTAETTYISLPAMLTD